MSSGWYVTSQDINYWSNTNQRKAQEILPLLIRKLVLASVNPSFISFPAGDSILVGGWDGHLVVEQGNMFVPSGQSLWEFGTNQSIKKKADTDYDKRTKSLKSERQDITFVFVTTRTWSNRDRWVSGKNEYQEWKQVKGINADDLELWLHQCPAVHRWFAGIIGKRASGVLDIEQVWEGWSCATRPKCNHALAVAGRNDHLQEFQDKLCTGPSLIRIWGISSEEAYAFTIAAIQQNELWASRFLLVENSDSWDELLDNKESLIMVPRFENTQRNLGVAIQHGHWVILFEPLQQQSSLSNINIEKADRGEQIKALISMGLSEENAQEVVRHCHGYLQSIRRHNLLDPIDYHKPEWVNVEHSQIIVPALLIGSWRADNTNDCEKVSEIAAMNYYDYEQRLNCLALCDDPPIRRVGDAWQFISRQDGWVTLSSFINASILERFGKVMVEVLSECNPRFELPPEKRWMANVYGKNSKYSGLFTRGLSEMSAMLACYGDQDCRNIGINDVPEQVSWWVKQILTVNTSWQRWGSLGMDLPLLAEAAPEVFLAAIEDETRGESPQIMNLFVEENDMGGCPHSFLLWALESVSWSLDHFSLVVSVLGRLARLDPGGKYSNRPSKCLEEIFCGWLPQTKATLNQRMNILENLLRREPRVGWKLLLNLLPNFRGVSHPIIKPKFREWNKGWRKGTNIAEYSQHCVEISNMIINFITNEIDPIYWIELIENLPQLPDDAFKTITAYLKRMDLDLFDENTMDEMGNKLRHHISRHRKFPESSWALPKEQVDELLVVYERFIPKDVIKKYSYLFDSCPQLVEPVKYEEYDEAIEKLRNDAIEVIWKEYHEAGICRLAQHIKLHHIVGNILGKCSYADEVECFMLQMLDNEENSLDIIAKNYVYARTYLKSEWIECIYNQYVKIWLEQKWVAFCLSLPFGKMVFNFLTRFSPDVSRQYWGQVQGGYYLNTDDNDTINWIVKQFIDHKRPIDAIVFASNNIKDVYHSKIDIGLIVNSLQEAVSTSDATQLPSIEYHIEKMISLTQNSRDVTKNQLAQIEWSYLPLMRYSQIRPKTLVNEICSNASFFVWLICQVYISERPEENLNSPPESQRQQVKNARELLDLVDMIPGQAESGDVDLSILKQWVDEARNGCAQEHRVDIGDQRIGMLLAHCLRGNDGIWPHEAVRTIIEEYENEHLEIGIKVEHCNQRGTTIRNPRDGGILERKLAEKYQKEADKLKYKWPRTAAVLRGIARDYIRHGVWEDISAELNDF